MILKKLNEKLKNKKILLVIVELELVIFLVIALAFLRHLHDYGNIEKYADTANVPVISAGDGLLEYNSVRVAVPDPDASYTIGYDWAKGDKDYASVPSSASAYYTDDSGAPVYEIILYRDRVIPKGEGKKAYSLDNWREEWDKASADSDSQQPYKASKTKGYLVRLDSTAEDSANKYCSYTYYFAVEGKSDIEQYVLEFNYYGSDADSKAKKLFKKLAKSITF